ncbi:MAG: metal ABC transporter ATP-binding protein [Pyrinomonadaceae bacterium]|nr:metal ABC transporter ATP-binding protein [Phycisphaerales bacterium]
MPATAIEFDSVSYMYPGAESAALENVSLRVDTGERLGILGPNGGGKSTLLKLMLGLLPMQAGRISLFGDLSPGAARKQGVIGYVPQRLEAELGFPLSTRQVVTLGATWRLRAWRPIPLATRQHIDRMIALVGAERYADQPIGKLSGGQVQRVLIARALAAMPKILALDEPTVGIDAAGQQRFAELLTTVHAELGVTIVIVSHDLRAIVAGSDRVACLARRLHSHVSPQGLTPQILAELFSHDLVGLRGVLGDVHVHAHAAEGCTDSSHSHPAGASEPIGISLPAKKSAKPGARDGNA